MKDRIELKGLAVETTIGVHSWERRVRQTLSIDLTLPVEAHRAAVADDLSQALDYSAVAAHVRAHCAEARWLLLETLAERIAHDLIVSFDLPWVALTLNKPGAVPDCAEIRLSIERHRPPA
ncbi:MAG: dihydroneopterin aldolase [Pseudomonadales bacterium]|nr:dihydroneopterin aldolase [Pseudomonadales bacterium]